MNAQLAAHCAQPPRGVLFDEAAQVLLDVPSGKTLPLTGGVQSLTPLDGGLSLRLGDGRALALTPAGIAFAPGFLNTGPLEELTATVCWKDFQALARQLKHELYGPPGVAPTEATVRLLMCCLAIVDGARAAGFDVAAEEHELEWHLRELERQAPAP